MLENCFAEILNAGSMDLLAAPYLAFFPATSKPFGPTLGKLLEINSLFSLYRALP